MWRLPPETNSWPRTIPTGEAFSAGATAETRLLSQCQQRHCWTARMVSAVTGWYFLAQHLVLLCAALPQHGQHRRHEGCRRRTAWPRAAHYCCLLQWVRERKACPRAEAPALIHPGELPQLRKQICIMQKFKYTLLFYTK